MIEWPFIILILIFLIMLTISQKWYSSYLRERKEREKYMETYVMNLKEREEYYLNQQGFISFVRFLFLLSLLSTFLKDIVSSFLRKVNTTKRTISNSVFYKAVKKY